ncbi:MAG: baseplate J/gp47 family protein, partial [Candidatus Nanopelagicales bacterium]
MADVRGIFPDEDQNDIYERMVADMPPPANGSVWESRVGSVVHALLTPMVAERIRMMDFAREVVSSCFLYWADGEALEAKADEFGVTRLPPSVATGYVTFYGADNTVIPIGSQVAAPGDDATEEDGHIFITQTDGVISGGEVTVPIIAEEDGADANVPAGAITELLTPVDGVDYVENGSEITGGRDQEGDDGLRDRALIRAQQQPTGGNKGYYLNLAYENSQVYRAEVEDRWNTMGPGQVPKPGEGSGRLVISGPSTAWVPPKTVDDIQLQIDPSVRCIAHFEGDEAWVITDGESASASSVTGGVIEGERSWRISPSAGLSTTITRAYATPISVSDVLTDSSDEIWLAVRTVTGTAETITIEFADTERYNVCAVSVASGDIPADGRLIVTKSDLSASVGSVDSCLLAIKTVATTVESGLSQCEVVVDALRVARAQGGNAGGFVTLGMQMTVASAYRQGIDISAEVMLSPGASIDGVKPTLEVALNELLFSLGSGDALRIAQVANRIFVQE